jgi:hypothetical protein
MVHHPEMVTDATARATTAGGRLDRLDRVRVDVRLDRDGRDSDVPANVDPDKLTGAGQPVDIPWFDAKPFGYLGNGEKLTGVIHHRSPSRSRWAWTVVD